MTETEVAHNLYALHQVPYSFTAARCDCASLPRFIPALTFHLFIFLSISSSPAEFREPRVIELWEAAKRANLTKDELDSLKVALTSLS